VLLYKFYEYKYMPLFFLCVLYVISALMNTVCYMESYARRSNLWQVSLLNQRRVPSGLHFISVNDAERSSFLFFLSKVAGEAVFLLSIYLISFVFQFELNNH
jgi:hypothetical protein